MSNIGAVIIANNTDRFDYIRLASISAEKLKKHLKIPVALITEDMVSDPVFDTVIKANNANSNTRVFSKTNENWSGILEILIRFFWDSHPMNSNPTLNGKDFLLKMPLKVDIVSSETL